MSFFPRDQEKQGDFDFQQKTYTRDSLLSMMLQSQNDRNFNGYANGNNFTNGISQVSQVNRPSSINPQMALRNQSNPSMMESYQNGLLLQRQLQQGSNINSSVYGNRTSLNDLSSQSPMLLSNNQRLLNENNNNTSFDTSNNLNFSMSSSVSSLLQNLGQSTSGGMGNGSVGGGGSVNSQNRPLNMSTLTQQSPSLRDVDFTILNEDFPALPGSQSMKPSDNLNGNLLSVNNNNMSTNHTQTNANLSMLSQDSVLLQSHLMSNSLNSTIGNNAMSRAISNPHPTSTHGNMAQLGQQPFTGGPNPGGGMGGNLGGLNTNTVASDNASLVSSLTGATTTITNSNNYGNTLSKDAKYGLGGLLEVIRMTDKDLNILSLGSDLTQYGLNLTSVDCLYSTFLSPFNDQNQSSTDTPYSIPTCYMMQPPNLKPEHLTKFQVETLFYVFYSMPKDVLQAFAVQELYRREWRFHGELKIWMKTRGTQELLQSHPSTPFAYFDVTNWETRPFTATYRGAINTGWAQEEEVRLKYLPTISITTVSSNNNNNNNSSSSNGNTSTVGNMNGNVISANS